MLSLNRGRPIAKIIGGSKNGEIIHIYDPEEKCCDKCSAKCGIKSKYCCKKCPGEGGCLKANKESEPDIKYTDIFDVIDEDVIRRQKKKMNWNEMGTIRNAIQDRQMPSEPKMREIYSNTLRELIDKSKREIYINDEGGIRVLPNQKPERIYAAGPSDSGKSHWCGCYIEEWVKEFPDRFIFLFSDVEKDAALDKFKNLKRVKINEELLSKPLKSTDFPNGSLCIFDDIDSIQDEKILKAVETLRDHLLRRARHEGIYVIVSNHLITDYKKTRIILNEISAFTFFPKSGSTHGIVYALKKYCGLNIAQVNKIFSLNSRWVTVYKNYPMYVVYNKGLYLL